MDMDTVVAWEEISRVKIFKGHRYDIDEVSFLFPDGKIKTRLMREEPDVVGILAVTTEGGVIMVECYRPGPKKVLLELPGGDVDEGEKAIQAARRELLEETGYQGKKFKLVATSFKDAYATAKVFTVVIAECSFIGIPKNSKKPRGFRQIKLLSLNEFRQHVKSGQMTNIQIGYLALDYLNQL
jgi:ADP-ribose pyrophosphatase